jgi:cell division protein FtsA
MDVGGGTTDIAVVNEGGVEGTKMFGIGGRAFTQAIARELDADFKRAESLKLSLGSEQVPEELKSKIKTGLTKTLNVWASGVELALAEFNKLDNLPHRVLLCGGGSSLEMLMDELEHKEWHKNLPFTRKPTVHHIKPNEVVGITDTTGSITDHTYITAMGLLRVGLDTINSGAAGDPASIKDKLNKVLRT